jgi:hypothetical protein
MSSQDETAFSQYVSEADIDWILCIEINSNPRFREWLGTGIFHCADVLHDGAWRSVANEYGESDLVWRVRLPHGQYALALMENKINAVAQPEQYNRYVARGKKYVGTALCQSYTTVLLAPQSYSSRDSGRYEKPISYESLQEWFKSQGGERDLFIASMLEAAIEKRRPEPDAGITEFRRKFWELARDEFPWLGLKEPGPLREYWVWQDYNGFTMVYKTYSRAAMGGFFRSVVDLQIWGRALELDRFEAAFGEELKQRGGVVTTAGQSIAFRMEARCAHPPEFDVEVARDALSKWDTLHRWWTARSQQVDARELLKPRLEPADR